MLKPALGGLILGLIGISFPQVFADGYETIKLTLYGNVMLWLMVILIFLKIVATSLTLGSGNSGTGLRSSFSRMLVPPRLTARITMAAPL